MYYPDEVIEEVRMKSDIVGMISGYVKLQKKGANYFGPCPFHNEKSPPFSVSPRKRMYYCSGCGAGGNVITFLMEYESYTFQEAFSSLTDRARVNLPRVKYGREARGQAELRARLLKVNKLATNYFYYQMKRPQGKPAYDYFHLRGGLADETIVHFDLGYSNKTNDDLYRYLKGKGYEDNFLKDTGLVMLEERSGRGRFWSRVMLPVVDVNNRIIRFEGRVMGDGEPKYLDSPEIKLFDESRNLYGLNYARSSREGYLLICEGYLDVISLHQAGFTNAMAPLGTAFTSQHANMLKRYMDQATLTYSGDGTGMKAALRAIPILEEVGMFVKVLDMRPYRDPGEFVKNMGAEAFHQWTEKAKGSFLSKVDVLRRGYEMGDPEQKTEFYRETARKLLQFDEVLERENHLQAVVREQMIPAGELKGLVSRMGMSMGLKAGESLSHSGRVVPQETEEEGFPGGESDGSRKPRWPDKEDGIRRSQRLLLTRLIETPALLEKIEGVITTDDFVEDLYHQVAQIAFSGHREGNLSPAAIPSRFINDEDQYKEMAALFNVSLRESLNNEEQKETFLGTMMKVRESSLDVASRNAKDITQLQEVIRQQTALKWLHVSLDWQHFIGRMDQIMEGTDVFEEKLAGLLEEAGKKKNVLECQGVMNYFDQEPPAANQLDRLFKFLDQNKAGVVHMGTEDKLDPDLFIKEGMELDGEEEVDMEHLDLSIPEGVSLEDPVHMYLRGIGRISLLGVGDEVELAKKMKLNDPEARKRLAKSNLCLVVDIAKRYMGGGTQFLDLIQEGNLGLIKVVERFDCIKGYKFNAYATWRIRQVITGAVANQAKTIWIPVHMVETVNRLVHTSCQLLQELGGEPTTGEIVARLDLPVERISEIMKMSQEPMPLEAPIGEKEDSHLGDFIQDDNVLIPQDATAFTLLHEQPVEVLLTLTEREQEVLRLRFGLDDRRPRTLEEVEKQFNMTRERIHQIEARALRKLRRPSRSKKLKDYLDE